MVSEDIYPSNPHLFYQQPGDAKTLYFAQYSAVFHPLASLIHKMNPIIGNNNHNTIRDIKNISYLKIGSILPINSRHYPDALKHMKKDIFSSKKFDSSSKNFLFSF